MTEFGCDRNVCYTNLHNDISCKECVCMRKDDVASEIDLDEVADEIDFIAEHSKADMSNVDRIIINKKVYLSADKIMEIMTEAEKHDQYFRYAYGEIEKLKGGEYD